PLASTHQPAGGFEPYSPSSASSSASIIAVAPQISNSPKAKYGTSISSPRIVQTADVRLAGSSNPGSGTSMITSTSSSCGRNTGRSPIAATTGVTVKSEGGM